MARLILSRAIVSDSNGRDKIFLKVGAHNKSQHFQVVVCFVQVSLQDINKMSIKLSTLVDISILELTCSQYSKKRVEDLGFWQACDGEQAGGAP